MPFASSLDTVWTHFKTIQSLFVLLEVGSIVKRKVPFYIQIKYTFQIKTTMVALPDKSVRDYSVPYQETLLIRRLIR
jgi:hypothetical protein